MNLFSLLNVYAFPALKEGCVGEGKRDKLSALVIGDGIDCSVGTRIFRTFFERIR